MKSQRISSLFLWLGVLLCLPLLQGCPSAVVKQKKWLAPTRHPLLRGLKAHMNAREVEATICQRWALGKCQGWEFLRTRSYAKRRVKLYKYVDPYAVASHLYYFYFSEQGLLRIQVRYKLPSREAGQALIRRYKRWYKKPDMAYSLFSGRRLRWNPRSTTRPRIQLTVYRSYARASHIIIPRYWADFAPSLIPIDRASKGHWKGLSDKVKREVAEMFGRFAWGFKRNTLWYSMNRLNRTGWVQKKQVACKTQKASNDFRDITPWRYLYLSPPRQLRLQYRVQWTPWAQRPADSLFPFKQEKDSKDKKEKTNEGSKKSSDAKTQNQGILLASRGPVPLPVLTKLTASTKKPPKRQKTKPTSKPIPRKKTKLKKKTKPLTRAQRRRLIRRKLLLRRLGVLRRRTGILSILKGSGKTKGSSVFGRSYKFGTTTNYRRKSTGLGGLGLRGRGFGVSGKIGTYGRGGRGFGGGGRATIGGRARGYRRGRGYGSFFRRRSYSREINTWIRLEAKGCGYHFWADARRRASNVLEIKAIHIKPLKK